VEILKKIRTSKGISQSELAKLSGLSQPAIHYIENGKKDPTRKTLKKLAVALDVPVSHLLDEIA
jgi:transcriptional regulator with XRE-family HTH domain